MSAFAKKEVSMSIIQKEVLEVKIPLGEMMHALNRAVMNDLGLPERAYFDKNTRQIIIHREWSMDVCNGVSEHDIKIVEAMNMIKEFVFRVHAGPNNF